MLDDDGNPWPAAVQHTVFDDDPESIVAGIVPLSRPESAESMDDDQSTSLIQRPDEPQMNIDRLCSFAIGRFLQSENCHAEDQPPSSGAYNK